jgi:hypothetical protein
VTPRYHIYPSLLDSFAYMKNSEAENALEEFMAKLNRVQTPPSDAIMRGVMFEQYLNDHAAKGIPFPVDGEGFVRCHDTNVPVTILEAFSRRLDGSVRQVFVESVVEALHGPVRLYGFVDNVLRDTAIDVKTTSKYEFPKYLKSFQRPVYLHALKGMGITRFEYLVTDFREVYVEAYQYTDSDHDRLVSEVNALVEFIEANRDKITAPKLFGK